VGLTDSTSTTTGARSPFLRNLRSGVDGGAATTPTALSASSSKGREASHTSHLSEQMGLINVHRQQGHSRAPGDGGGEREGMVGAREDKAPVRGRRRRRRRGWG